MIGVLLIGFIVYIGNNIIIKNAATLYIIGILVLIILLVIGVPINNAKCWFKVPGIGTIQPSEFMKIILVIYLSVFISENQKKNKSKSNKNEFILLMKIMFIVAIPAILTFLEPDTGAVFMYLILTLTILFVSKFRMRWFYLGIASFLSLISFVLYLYFFNINLFIKLLGNSFFLRIERIINWSSSVGMQLENGMTAIGAAGYIGYGFNKTPIYFPEAHTDFIFAVYASNFGFIGSVILLMLIIYFDMEVIHIAERSKNRTNRYIVSGILGILIYQQIQNIGMTFGLLPITGITLPFISYGGSSLLSYMIMIGLIFNINNENKQYKN
jgi:rod shape determining protein RodA